MKPLSKPSALGNQEYLKGTSYFFDSSKLLGAQITELYDNIWPIVAAIKNLKWQVRGVYEEYENITNEVLTRKFVETKDKNVRANLYRFCLDTPWETIEGNIARTLLTNIFALYESWEHMLGKELSININKKLQFPGKNQAIIASLTPSSYLEQYYILYKSRNKNYDLTKIDNWLNVYRYFKEVRNNDIHNGGIVNEQKVIDAYNIVKNFTSSDLGVKEVPQIYPVTLGEPIELSLRGVVGFSQIIIKLVQTFDIEFIQYANAEKSFCSKIKNVYDTSNKNIKNRYRNDTAKFILSLTGRSNYLPPTDTLKIHELLKNEGVI